MSTSMTPSGAKRPASGSTDTPTRDKRLKTIACDRCRRRKVKCDGDGYNQTPCKYCVSVNLDCTYGQKTARTSSANNQSSKANSTPRQVGRNPARSKTTSTAINNTDNINNSPSSANRQRRASSHTISHQNTKQNIKKSPTSSTSNLSINTNGRRNIPQDLPTPDNKKNDFEYMVKLYISTTLQNENQVRQQLKRYVQIPQAEESSPPRLQTNNTLLEDAHFIGHLVDLYFKKFHPFLPVIHKAYFMERFNDKSKLMSPLLIYAVCAIGSSYTNNPAARKDGNNPYTVGLAFYESAQDMVKHYFDLPRLSTATALFLLGVFDALRSLRSRMYVGMATTLAITMRFHDKNAFSETLSVNEREARKRLWWGIAIANRLQCISLNRILAFQDNHCNIGYPDENCVDDTEHKITVYYRCYLMITNTIYEILESNLNDSDVNINFLEDKLNTWKKQLPPYLNIEGTKGLDTTYNETTIEHLRIYLCILYNYAMIRIHHPNISYAPSSVACTIAAKNITSLVNEHLVNVINSKQFIIHCALYAGFIHIYNLKNPQHTKDSMRNIAATIKLFQNILNVPSLHHTHNSIKNSIAIFASQLEGIPDVEDYIMDIVKAALVLISGNSGNNSSNGSPVSPNDESRNINNNNNVNNMIQDNSPISFGKKLSPIQQSAQNSSPRIELLAHTAVNRSSHYGPISPINHGPTGLQQPQQISQQSQQQQQQQSIFATVPTPLDPPITSAKIDSTNPSLMPDINYSSTQYIHQHSTQSRQHDNNSTWQSNYNNYQQQWPHQSNHLHPIQTQPHQNVQQQTTVSPTGNEAQTMMVINNSPVTTSSRTISMTSPKSLAPLLIGTTSTNTTFASPQMFSYQNSVLPSVSYLHYSTSQQQQPQHSSQPYLAPNTSPPSTIGISGNFVAGNEMSTGLAPMTGMIGNSGGATNGMMSTSENSVSMLIDSQGSSAGELDAQQHQHHHQHQRRTSSQASYY